MGIEEYSRKKYDPGIGEVGFGIPGAGKGLESLLGGVRDWWRERKLPEKKGIARYHEEPRNRGFIPDPTELILGERTASKLDRWMTEKMVRPFGGWIGETVVPSAKEWWHSYERGSPVTGDVSRDWGDQGLDIGKGAVNALWNVGKFGADIGTDIYQSSLSKAQGNPWLSKGQKYNLDAMLQGFGAPPMYEDNPYTKYDWSEDWTEKTNPILWDAWGNAGDVMYDEFLTEPVIDEIWGDIGYDKLEGKTRKEQGDMFHEKFYEKHTDEWNKAVDDEQEKLMRTKHGVGTDKGWLLDEYDLWDYDPLIDYSTPEAERFLGGVGEAAGWIWGPGMYTKGLKYGKKLLPKGKRAPEGIMGAKRLEGPTDYDWADEYLRTGGR